VTVTVNPAGGGQPPGGGGQPGAGCAGAPNIPFFTANPSTITAGQSSTLSWGNITNGTTGPLVRSAVIEPGLGEVGSGASSRQVKPNTTTTYTLTATGCGGTVTRQVTVTVGSGGGGAGTTTADLAITDIYTDSQWKLYVKIRNNGPGQLTNAVAKLTCSVGVTPPGGIPSKTGSSGPITLNLNSGQETAIATGGTLNTVAWYDVTCSIQAQTFNDSNSANNSLQKKITHGP
jgi:hypothetical protein